MTFRLVRIEAMVLGLTALSAALALGTGRLLPLGIALGGGIAAADFVLIRRLAMAALARRPPLSWIVAVALGKSLLLVLVPAVALLLPGTGIDGVSFAVGVSTLPLAVVLDALLPVPRTRSAGSSVAG